MNEETGKVPDSYRNVQKMLDGIPQELWYIFLPDSEEGLAMLEADILAQESRDLERKRVMAIQRLCEFPLRPNEPLRNVIMQAKSMGLKDHEFPRDEPRNKRKGNTSDNTEDNPNSLM